MNDRTPADQLAATAQGLDPITAALAAAGAEYAVEGTGGYVMAVTVRTATGTYALNAETMDPAAPYAVGWYPGTAWHDGDLADGWALNDVSLPAFAHAVSAAQCGALPDADTVEAAGLDPTLRERHGIPWTWRDVTAALLARVAERTEANR